MATGKTDSILLGVGIILVALILSVVITPDFADHYGKWIGGFMLFGGIGIGLFLILRIFNLWYWKIDKIVKLLEKIEENTRNETH